MNINPRSAALMILASAAIFSVCLAVSSPASAQQPTAASPAAVQKKAAKVKVFQVHNREAFLAKYGADKVRQLRRDEPNPLILRLSADAPIKDLRILDLTFKGFDDKGKINFDEKERILVGEVNPEDIILIDLIIYGDIPNNGVSYTDADGTVKRFSVNISGEDGSPQLQKY